MTLLSPSLSDMPHHILQQIATYTNERTIWATMATSRAFREAGEKALKGHLAQKAITAYPPFMLNGESESARIVIWADDIRFRSHLPHYRY